MSVRRVPRRPHEGDAVTLVVPARAEHIGLVRLVVTAVAKAAGVTDIVRLDDIRLAVSEAVANAVEAYGRQGRPGAMVTLRLEWSSGIITVEVSDAAGGFDPGALVPHPPVETPERLHHERGLGVPLMRQLADEVAFASEQGGTTVRMVFGETRKAG